MGVLISNLFNDSKEYRNGQCKIIERLIENNDIDEELIDIIRILNSKGYYTASCCQGHHLENKNNIPIYTSIVFTRDKDMFISPFDMCEECGIESKNIEWWSPKPHSTFNPIIRCSLHVKTSKSFYENKKEEERLKNIEFIKKWVDKLPNLCYN